MLILAIIYPHRKSIIVCMYFCFCFLEFWAKECLSTPRRLPVLADKSWWRP
ncbi:unnamed protein product [Acanthoscelides obtectus]|uniref:Uncharacterized protein n=1 Tax=Acanthoscelides obtectus TaxID=200917 RepID=A0A9P0MDC5_ACAOB|nr:unnamed protein product [Acanthoscelides obtectus]CAK1679487.1 hypothetical protein AOBTE_LOCUS32285 [Acanthoscelides obtectus]